MEGRQGLIGNISLIAGFLFAKEAPIIVSVFIARRLEGCLGEKACSIGSGGSLPSLPGKDSPCRHGDQHIDEASFIGT